MKKVNKKIVILIITIILLLTLGVSVYAYFRATSTKDVTGSTGITTESVIEIASFDDLFDYSKASAYNDSRSVSNSNNRKILKLTSDVSLTTNLVITSDVHLYLNGNTLNLNDYTLTFNHGYAGVFNIYSGTINLGTNGNGKLVVDLPKASFITNGMIYKSGDTTTTESACIEVLNIDSKYTAYSALYLVSNNLASDLDKRVKFEDFDSVNDNSFTISQDKFIKSKTCSFNSNNSDICSFVYKDLDLIDHYLSTDVNISYLSSNTAILSNDGKVTLPSTSSDVNLTVTINHESWDNPISCVFKLHVVNLSNATVKNNVAKDLIKAYLSDYYHGNDLRINETIILTGYYYGFDHGVTLPLTALGDNITYSYTLKDLSGNVVNTTSHTEGNTYVLEPNSKCFMLVINYNNNSIEELNMYSQYAGDRETIARLILNKLYGGSIVFDSSRQSKELFEYSDLETELDSITYGYVTSYNITGLSYTLKASTDAETYYNLSNYELTVADGQIPTAKASYITVTFTFGSGASLETLDIDLYIDYLASSGNTVAGFLPYYNLYDPQVVSYMTQSFEMPFCFGTGAPFICYDFANVFTKTNTTVEGEEITYYTYTYGMPTTLKIVLYYNGQERFTFTNYTTQTSFTSQLNSHLSSSGKTLAQIAAYSDAKYIFKIDSQNAEANSSKLLLLYNYTFTSSSNPSWNLYNYHIDNTDYVTELTATEFTVDGGLFYNTSSNATNAVADKYFFIWIYNNFNPDTTAAAITASNVNSQSFIPKSWLSLDVALDKTQDNTLSNVTNYQGIGNLTNITKVNLSGINLTQSVLTSISSMESVTDLNLSNCGITNISSICTMNSIKVLDVSRNSIKDFNSLVNLKNLEEVYIYSNNATNNNPIVGSLGITNLQAYNDLLRNGVAVFNQVSSDVPVIYADSDDYNDYVKLKSIIYQNKLSTNVSITTLYTHISSAYTTTNLSLVNTGTPSFTWGYQGDSNDSANHYMLMNVTVGASVTANTYYELTNGSYTLTTDTTFKSGKDYYVVVTANNATYFYVNYSFKKNNVTYTVNVKFYVDRY